MFKFVDFYDVEFCRKNKGAIVVFGDNLEGHGKKGQAIIRDESNAFGVPTKKKPSMSYGSFFSDKQEYFEIVKNKLVQLWKMHEEGKTIILPTNQLDTGLSQIEQNAPQIHAFITRFYKSAKDSTNTLSINELKEHFPCIVLNENREYLFKTVNHKPLSTYPAKEISAKDELEIQSLEQNLLTLKQQLEENTKEWKGFVEKYNKTEELSREKFDEAENSFEKNEEEMQSKIYNIEMRLYNIKDIGVGNTELKNAKTHHLDDDLVQIIKSLSIEEKNRINETSLTVNEFVQEQNINRSSFIHYKNNQNNPLEFEQAKEVCDAKNINIISTFINIDNSLGISEQIASAAFIIKNNEQVQKSLELY